MLGRCELRIIGGETVALMGPSGIGKTTLMRIAAGLHRGFEGVRRVQGRLAMVFQEPQLLPWRSLVDNIVLAAKVDAATASRALAEVGLAEAEHRFPGQLSLGQARRAALARAFAARPDLLLMDEPLASLDDATANEIMTLFETMRARYRPATLLITHSAEEAARLADRIVRLKGSPATTVQDAQRRTA